MLGHMVVWFVEKMQLCIAKRVFEYMYRSACLACALCDLFTHVDVHAVLMLACMGHAMQIDGCVNREG